MAEDNTTNQSADTVLTASEVEPQVTRVRKPSTRKKKTDESVPKPVENVANEAQESGQQAETSVPKKPATKTTRARKTVVKKEKSSDEVDSKEAPTSERKSPSSKAVEKSSTKKAPAKRASAKKAPAKKTSSAKKIESAHESAATTQDIVTKTEQPVEHEIHTVKTKSEETLSTTVEKPAPKRRGRPRKVVVESVETKKEDEAVPANKDKALSKTDKAVEKPKEKKVVKRVTRKRNVSRTPQPSMDAEFGNKETTAGSAGTGKEPHISLEKTSEAAATSPSTSAVEPANTVSVDTPSNLSQSANIQPVKRARRRPGDAGGSQNKIARKYTRTAKTVETQTQREEKRSVSAQENISPDIPNVTSTVPARRPRVKRTRHTESAHSTIRRPQPQSGDVQPTQVEGEKNSFSEEIVSTENKGVTPSRTQRPARNGVSRETQRERLTNSSRSERPNRTYKSENSDKGEQAAKNTRYEKNVRTERSERRSQDKQRYESSSLEKKKDTRKTKDVRKRRGIYEPVEIKASKDELHELKVADLREMATKLNVDFKGLKKTELIDAVYEGTLAAEGFQPCKGVLDFVDSHAVIRVKGYLKGPNDVYVAPSLVRRFGLRRGDFIEGIRRGPQDNEKHFALQHLGTVNTREPLAIKHRPKFADLVPIYPEDMLLMEHGKESTTGRTIDLVSPVGKGQRGLIVSPPKAGKTTILKQIADSVASNNPEVHLICLLVDERPEEVTDMTRSINGEVVASTFDMPAENHIAVSELVIERAKRLVELGDDVVILLDSITRLARAYNLGQPASGRILSGGVDSAALYPPKRFLGAARNIENGGSLTILASALIDTGSKMDEVIFEEFKGTGNMELKLDRDLADRRVYPAVDTIVSGTRKEELLLDPELAPLIWGIRRMLANNNSNERAMQMLLKSFKQTDTNRELLIRSAKRSQNNEQN